MGFFDLNGQLGRRFGSLGLGLNAPNTLVELAVGNHVFGEASEADYVRKSKAAILAYAHIEQAVSVKVHEEIPRHFGLGSGTQMALAIGAGINQLFKLDLSSVEIASIIGRGMRSGIGVGTFVHGGLVVDGGRGARTKVPPIIAQYHFPPAWRIILIFDHAHDGVHGVEEADAFTDLENADTQATEKISHQILMQALPALHDGDLDAFGEAIAALQAYTGDYFSPVQGGRYASSLVTKVLHFLSEQGVACVGQSSWGPTGFAVVKSEQVAEQYLLQLKSIFKEKQLSWLVCSASNTGASINVRE
jgi:beta-RFAP synthase